MKHSLPLSYVFPVAHTAVRISTNSPSLSRYLKRDYSSSLAAREPALLFEVTEDEGGQYHFRCPQVKFNLLIHNKSGREQNWCVMETVKIISQYYFLREGIMFLHASAIVHLDRGYVFAGFSGSGKSTIAGVAAREKIADDQVVLAKSGKGYCIYSSVFDIKHVHPNYDGAPLSGLYLLVQSKSLAVKEITSMGSILSFLFNNDLFNAAFEFYLNQNKEESQLHYEIAGILLHPRFKEKQFQLYLRLYKDIRFHELRFPRHITKIGLLDAIIDPIAKNKKSAYH